MKIKNKSAINSPVFSYKNKLYRLFWSFICVLFFRPSPIPFRGYRRFILQCFGAEIGRDVNIYPSVKIWLPSNLIMGDGSSLGPSVNIYNQGLIRIGNNVIISQGAHLCASTHNYNDPIHPLLLAPITINDNVWVCAEAFVGPYVTLTEGTVVGARAVIFKKSEPWTVYSGNPAKAIKKRSWGEIK